VTPVLLLQVRRELASALRDITCLVGSAGMASFMAAVVQAAWQQYQSAVAVAVGGACGLTQSQHPVLPAASWTHLECALYAANVILGQTGGSSSVRGSALADPAAVAQLMDVALACVAQHSGVGMFPGAGGPSA
jgi:hypothetical protein